MKKLLTMLFLLFSLIGYGTLNSTGLDSYEMLTIYKKLQIYNTHLVNKIEGKENEAYREWNGIPVLSPLNVEEIKNISSDYGYRNHPIYHFWSMHDGVDFSAKLNTKVFSTANGIITRVKRSDHGYGCEIVVKHDHGYDTRYAHLSLIYVKEGDKVLAGDCIGTVGNSGLSTGPHLHYEVMKDYKSIDPMFFTYKDTEDRSIGKYFTTLIALGNS